MNLAIVQARYASQRLPGKVMKKVLGRPLVGYIFERLKFSEHIDKIILATSNNAENDQLADYIRSINFDVFRGDEKDVLKRFYEAAKYYKAKNIIRITGDCPLIDVTLCDKLIALYLNKKVSLAYTDESIAEGLDCEVFSFSALEKCFYQAELISEREHVTLYMYNHPEQFQQISLSGNGEDQQYRLTVDEEVDFQVVEEIIKHFFQIKKDLKFSFNDIKQFLREHPPLLNKNGGVIRNEGLLKSLRDDYKVVK
ncbi:MAG: glycosyltransferase family protein [Candidatus Omnitrophica bacterium]|nr:glycosyltransferase family protein [Candidatus Omnitrophota bacterium]